MEALINWAGVFVAAHPQLIGWLLVTVMVDNYALKPLKNAFKLNIPDNVFDFVGDILHKIIEAAKSKAAPKP